jgi:hypothetical protein
MSCVASLIIKREREEEMRHSHFSFFFSLNSHHQALLLYFFWPDENSKRKENRKDQHCVPAPKFLYSLYLYEWAGTHSAGRVAHSQISGAFHKK